MCKEWEQQKIDDEKRKNPDKFKPEKPLSSIYNYKGEMRQCNEGKYSYKLREWDDPDFSYFEMKLSKFLDTKDIDVNLYERFVSVRVKTKLTQMRTFEEIIPDASKVQRSEITGELVITMRKKIPDETMRGMLKRNKEEEIKKMTEDQKEKERKKEEEAKRIKELCKKAQEKMKIQELETKDCMGNVVDDSDDEVPDLE